MSADQAFYYIHVTLYHEGQTFKVHACKNWSKMTQNGLALLWCKQRNEMKNFATEIFLNFDYANWRMQNPINAQFS